MRGRRHPGADQRRGAQLSEIGQERDPENLPGRPHGLADTHKDQLNADLLAFLST